MGPKVQTHDLATRTHTVKAGTFPVRVYLEHPHGLYVERPFYDHPLYRYWQAHILPGPGWQVCRFTPHQGEHWCEYYVDIVSVRREGSVWSVQDLYLDLGVTRERAVRVLDTEELFAALEAGLISHRQAAWATAALHGLINALAEHGNDLPAMLRARGVELGWGLEVLS
ncbi:hypothetical protein Mterra_02935 [Calidithermus terrae]|uniref:DUF402 domain-containing protein n=1 Tax=Calidithermus terrae TaxID=1408545 RepID=A0A399EHS1_9DEIN|nr:DUF402 domain-containing protein [Calidithermus terrae]RIH81862.1 hypothetical protein Mterra_02935 [Calidithermus terrae]